nr:hypothetical protein CFP56_23948 [Quercus suber]
MPTGKARINRLTSASECPRCPGIGRGDNFASTSSRYSIVLMAIFAAISRLGFSSHRQLRQWHTTSLVSPQLRLTASEQRWPEAGAPFAH